MTRTPRFQTGIAGVLLLAGSGLLAGSPALFAAALVPLTYVTYGAVSSAPEPADNLTITRKCTPESPLPGEQVTVELTITNDSTQTLSDVRIADGVPGSLDVTSGTAITGMTLRAGTTATLSYTLQPTRGTYEFTPPTVRVRGMAATSTDNPSVAATGTTTLRCVIPTEAEPLRQQTIPFVGSVATNSSGVGLEFHSTREYRHGDPVNQVNWRQYARTGELGTTLFREQQAANVVVIVDARADEAQLRTPGQPDGVTLATYAAVMSANAFLSAHHNVGFAAFGTPGDPPGIRTGPPAYVEPGLSGDTRARVGILANHVAAQFGSNRTITDTATPEAATSHSHDRLQRDEAQQLVSLLPSGAQLLYCTPALTDDAVAYGTTLRQHGYELTVISPTLTNGATVGASLAAVERTARLDELRSLGASVIEWDPDEPLETALTRATKVIQ